MLKSGHLVYTDSVAERGTNENVGTEAFVWGDTIDVVYIEEEFFGTNNSLTGLTNWARIVVHELTHREVNTKDHAYEHKGINPEKLTAAKAIENADSWAWFCADCGGALTEGQIKNAMDPIGYSSKYSHCRSAGVVWTTPLIFRISRLRLHSLPP